MLLLTAVQRLPKIGVQAGAVAAANTATGILHHAWHLGDAGEMLAGCKTVLAMLPSLNCSMFQGGGFTGKPGAYCSPLF